MMKRSFSTKEKTLLIFLCVIILAFAYYMLVDMNVKNSLASIESQKSTMDMEIQLAEAKALKMQAMQAELDEIEASGYKSLVPEYDNLSKEIIFLNEVLARTSEISIAFDDVEITDGIARRPAVLEFTCAGYKEACQIIEKLQNCQYCCRLGKLEMEPTEVYDSTYTEQFGYGFDIGNSILRSPLCVNVSMTFFEKVTE